MADVPNTVTVTAVGTDGVTKTDGLDTFILRVEQVCTPVDAVTCTVDPGANDNVSGVPADYTMTHIGGGTYSADYTILADSGTISVSVILVGGAGLQAQYFLNNSWSGTPSYTQFET